MAFTDFSAAVHKRYAELAQKELYVVDVEDLFVSYLAAFPEGTNPMFRQRTEHDCNCCKNFIRRLGIVVGFDDNGNRLTVWDDFPELAEPYGTVARALAAIVRQAPIVSVFRTKERQYGSNSNWDNHDDTIKWNHFVGRVADKHWSTMPDQARGRVNTRVAVFQRGLTELKPEALDTVIELIESNNLYRGIEHRATVGEFRTLQRKYIDAGRPESFAWQHVGHPSAGARNTVIGSLLVDLSAGVDLEAAVRMFESKVAPTNYKRPKSLITPKMIEDAVAKLDELGLSGAVERRMAKIEDVSINDVLFVDNEVRGKMKGGLTDLLMGSAQMKKVSIGTPKPISIDDFMKLGASSISLMIANDQVGNFATLTAPQHESTGKLFKWDNDFAWSYDGEVADSLKERVKTAGGKTGANVKLRVSLGWHNSDDLDLHCKGPDGHIYYGNKYGVLDVDMNAGGRTNSKDPVENLSWIKPRDGVYHIIVDQFSKRNSTNEGFVLEVDNNGQLHQFVHSGPARSHATVLVIKMQGGVIASIEPQAGVVGGSNPQEKWGITTGTPVKVDTILLSPNHWDGAGAVGNKHWFFILEGCKNPEPVRGFFNEYLRGDLEPHRKVFEVLASKTKCDPTSDQLSGVGFSSTSKSKVIAIADGRTYEVEF